MSKTNLNFGSLLMCIAELVIGILLLMNPVGFTNSIIVLLGVLLIVEAVADMVSFIFGKKEFCRTTCYSKYELRWLS